MLVISRRSDEIIVGAARIRVEMTQNMLGFLIEMRSVNIYAAVPGEDQQFVNPFVFIVFQIFCKMKAMFERRHHFQFLLFLDANVEEIYCDEH